MVNITQAERPIYGRDLFQNQDILRELRILRGEQEYLRSGLRELLEIARHPVYAYDRVGDIERIRSTIMGVSAEFNPGPDWSLLRPRSQTPIENEWDR